jgi:hypothetical protein
LSPRKCCHAAIVEHDDMASEYPSDKPAVADRKQPRTWRPPLQPAPQTGSPLTNDGPELVRDSHC